MAEEANQANADLTFREIALGGPEFGMLIAEQRDGLVATGYTQEEADAMNTPGAFQATWIPGPMPMSVIGADVEEKLVGWIFLLRRDDGTGILESLWVRHGHRESGYGRKLVREAVARALSVGITTMEVHAMEREPKSVAFWEHLLQGPNADDGILTINGQRSTAKTWRLPTEKIAV